jgi:hypothetical protein
MRSNLSPRAEMMLPSPRRLTGGGTIMLRYQSTTARFLPLVVLLAIVLAIGGMGVALLTGVIGVWRFSRGKTDLLVPAGVAAGLFLLAMIGAAYQAP